MTDAPDDKQAAPARDDEKLKEIHAQAIARVDEAWLFERGNIEEGRQDQKFYAGDQWDDAAKKARGTDRPMLTVNRLPTFVRQLTGDVRQNTPAIKVLPAKGKASIETAEILNGLIRNIEAQSDADACYVIATENAAISGQGAFRIVTQYSDDDGFDQDIRIRPIRDPFGVLIDPMAQLPDKSDMGYAFVFERMAKDAFKSKYPNAAADDMPNNTAATNSQFDWYTGDSVRIAEYWCKEPIKKTIYQLEDGKIVEELPKGVTATRQREVETNKVVSYLMSGSAVLSGPHEWAGRFIPIGFVVGEEITIDGSTKRKGMVRDAKDPQKLYNYSRTAAAESIALQPKAPFVVTVDMIAGYENVWATAGTMNHPFLPYKVDKAAPTQRPERSQPAMGQQGLDSQAMLSASDMEAVTGIFKANLGAPSNETSGRAILSRQKEGDTGTFLYPDNLRRAMSYVGRCLVDLIPRIYDNERIVRVLKEDGSHEMATVNQNVPNPEQPGDYQKINDLSLGEYDVVVSTGKSFLTRRQEMADSLVQLAGNMPIIGQVAPDLVVKALDFPGGDELAARLERTVPPAIREDGPQQPPPPDPSVVAKAEADAAKADLTRAQTEGQEIKNVTDGVALMATLQAMHATMQMVQGQLAGLQGGPQMPGGPPGGPGGSPPPGAMPPGPPELPPPPPQMNGADGAPPMVELSEIQQ